MVRTRQVDEDLGRTYDDLCVNLRVSFYKRTHNIEGLILWVCNRENNFVIWIVLLERRFKVFIKVGVETLQRAKDRNTGSVRVVS